MKFWCSVGILAGAAVFVAALVTFLLSDESSYVNGGIYPVDGGSMA